MSELIQLTAVLMDDCQLTAESGRRCRPNNDATVILSAKAREYVLTGVGLCVCLSVCLSVTTITKKIVDRFVPNSMGRFLGGKGNQVRVLLRSVEGCESNGQKNAVNRLLFTFYISNSRCCKCCQVLATKNPNFAFAESCTLSEYLSSS